MTDTQVADAPTEMDSILSRASQSPANEMLGEVQADAATDQTTENPAVQASEQSGEEGESSEPQDTPNETEDQTEDQAEEELKGEANPENREPKADKAALRKMHEATQKAAELERSNAELSQRLAQMEAYLNSRNAGQKPSDPDQESARKPRKDVVEMIAKDYEDAFNEGDWTKFAEIGIKISEARAEAKTKAERVRADRIESEFNSYKAQFDNIHGDTLRDTEAQRVIDAMVAKDLLLEDYAPKPRDLWTEARKVYAEMPNKDEGQAWMIAAQLLANQVIKASKTTPAAKTSSDPKRLPGKPAPASAQMTPGQSPPKSQKSQMEIMAERQMKMRKPEMLGGE